MRRRNRKEPEGKVLADADKTRWLPDQSRDKATSSKLHMGQRSKFLMLLRPMPGYMAGKRKGMQRKLLINWTHSKGRHHPATNQQAVTAKTPPGNITTYGKRTIGNWYTNKRGGQPRSGDPGLGYPPPTVVSRSSAYELQRQRSKAEWIRNSNHQPTADKAAQPHQEWISSGREASLYDACKEPERCTERHKTMTTYPQLLLPFPTILRPPGPMGLPPAIRVSWALRPPCLVPAPPPPSYA